MREKLHHLLPGYGFFPLAAVVTMNMFVYQGSRMISQGLPHYSLAGSLDHQIPFIPEFISIYLLSFPFWIIGFILIARESREVCYRFLLAELIAKVFCLVFFILYPTTITRPAIHETSNLWLSLTDLIFRLDAPDNLFPSIHCLESWVCFRGAMHLKKTPRWWCPLSLVMALAVFGSTVFVKQHVVADMIGAVVIFEISLGMATRLLRSMDLLPEKYAA